MLTIDMDLVDETVTSPEDVRRKIEEFLEMLEDR